MSIAVEHGRFILTAINKSERILLPTASRCKRSVYRGHEKPGTAWTMAARVVACLGVASCLGLVASLNVAPCLLRQGGRC